MNKLCYDVIIIGSGMAGLYAAYQIKQKSPNTNFIILEKYKKKWLGGRTSNDDFYGTSIVTGAGIGREDTNTLLVHLMKELKVPYKKDISVMDYANTISNPVDPQQIIDLLRKKYKLYKNNKSISSLSFKEFAGKILGNKLYESFKISGGYTDYENADIYETLYNYGFDDNKGGWPILYIPWKRMVLTLLDKIGTQNIHFSRNVIEIKQNKTNNSCCFELICENGFKYNTNKVIVATTITSIQQLIPKLVPGTKHIYDQIHGQTFLRLYGKFDKKSAEIMKHAVPNYMIVPGPLQKIIPINSEKGIYMIAYSDNENAKSLHKYLFNTFENRNYFAKLIERSLGLANNSLYLIAIKDYYWPIGTHYYSPLKDFTTRESFVYQAQHPIKNVLVVGEAVSRYQGWVEGALESVEKVLTKKWIDSDKLC
jgi:protoporphyrinogen oxidase